MQKQAKHVRNLEQMMKTQIEARGIDDPVVLESMRMVDRAQFVPGDEQAHTYDDGPLPIGWQQTISQPYIVALMTQLLAPKPGDRILEIGTGSAYQTAVLAAIVAQVYTIEIIEPLAQRAKELLYRLHIDNVECRAGDGHLGWPEKAPFDGILITAAPETIPTALLNQLKNGGRMVLPVGRPSEQRLQVLTKTTDEVQTRNEIPVRFVPMTGTPYKK